jgi:hypothetical protein
MFCTALKRVPGTPDGLCQVRRPRAILDICSYLMVYQEAHVDSALRKD